MDSIISRINSRDLMKYIVQVGSNVRGVVLLSWPIR